METANLTTSNLIAPKSSCKGNFYAVYESCIINSVPSRDLAFIEERSFDVHIFDHYAIFAKSPIH